ncbi:AGC protein kinase [Polytolypa hystricis UAMH7299]|uniref:non-specific serine/threonine protein kinase n=1 Tax=Polytolypa hystricis (strain UAMH7299) TaxID=1447883 RepID=A0A2B7XSA6_POLH7|nr:AGC protein kinase [Polytolypa hystricis UAMH7299]
MADNGSDTSEQQQQQQGIATPQRFLALPAVTALKQEAARDLSPARSQPMTRTISEDIREERKDLKEAAEQTLNVIVDLDLDGRIKWVSPSWREVIGTPIEDVEGHRIADLVLDDKDVFERAVESMREDDSRSRIVRFAVKTGPESVFRQVSPPGSVAGDHEPSTAGVQEEEAEEEDGEERRAREQREGEVLNLEGQGIMVFDRSTGGESHTMWMLRPSSGPREVTIDLPPLLVESLGVGAEVLANYLTVLAEVGINDPAHHPPPMPVLCRICERQITPWWFEKHSDLCLQEHRAEMDVQMAQDNLNDHRHYIVRVLDALEARRSRSGSADGSPFLGPQAEYKGLSIGPSPSTPSSGLGSGSSSSSGTPPRSRDPSSSGLAPSGLGHARARSFAVRRPLARIVELILDLCDTALEISTPALKESRAEAGEEIRTQSPQSESRISQVLQWQSPSSNTLEQEQGLAALSVDTETVARAKVDAVLRHRRIVEYSERIRVEFTLLVEECISAAMRKAERIAAGELSDSQSSSSSSSSSVNGDDDQEDVPEQSSLAYAQDSAFPAPSSSVASSGLLSPPQGAVSDQSLPAYPGETRSSSVAVSSRSTSPMECPTPRSHRSVAGLLSHSQPSKRGSLLAESDAGDSDSGIFSSAFAGARRTESPSSERGLSRATSARDRKRQSLILPGMSSSPRRESPARNPPHSPLRLSKPRLSLGESLPSPTTSPLLNHSEPFTHNVPQYYPSAASHHHHHHHRRQSSTASPESGKVPISPHLTSVSQPPPRAVAPSIKDFEIIKPISKGAFGSVYLSKKKSTSEYFAIKVLKKADMVAKNQVTNVKAERAIMMWQGESDFVAKLYWTFSSKDYLYLVMEYLNGGDCASLVKVLGGLPEDWSKKYIAEVVLGIEHLHSRGIVHRDLKPDNLLIDQKGHLKLTDFGLSRMGLVGRQKRILKSPNESTPDLLKQGPFPRAASMASSRSASFDFPATHSPNTTPLITPEVGGLLNQPSYFSLSKEPSSLSREPSRRASGYRSDSGSSDTLGGMFRNFSLYETGDTPYPLSFTPQPMSSYQGPPIEEEVHSEGSDSPHLFPFPASLTHQSSLSSQLGTPPQQQSMMSQPPPMALFDPEDHNRAFVGTPDYLAPETINGVGQDEMSDWWSLGCILFEFLYGYPPFNASTPDEVFENILNRRINWPDEADELVTPEAKHLMNRLMTINPEQRLGANSDEKYPHGGAEVRAHPWFADINWDTLLEDTAQFVPAPENPEDTEYFDARGANLQSFTEELEDQLSPPPVGGGEYPDRPHDALYKVKSQVSTLKRGLMPLSIPPHVRDTRNRRLSEPVLTDDFGNFNFKNLPVLEKANKDVIQKLRQEAMQAQQRQIPVTTPVSGSSAGSGPSLEGSPLLPMPLKRTMSQNKPGNRPASPSSLSQANSSSPGRPSQPSSPLLVQFSTGQHHERRKTSGSSSTFSHQSSGSLQPGNFFETPRLSTNFKMASSAASSPIKHTKAPTPSPDKSSASSGPRQSSAPTSRARSQTMGSQDSELAGPNKEPYVPGHHKRRSQLFDISPSSSDNEDPRAKALLKVQRRRQSSRRLSQINFSEGPFFRPLDVLICEDHPVSKLVMERLFEKLRCRTITAVNGSEATRYALSEVQFDIIMTEFKLPQINGADVARMIRETTSANTHTPIIAVTGYLKDLPETHHFDALIEKPPTLAKLTETLCKFCQWKPPPKDHALSLSMQIPHPSGLSHASAHMLMSEDSPSSTSSGFVPMPPSSYRGSSRTDSFGSSSYFGDMESIKADNDMPIMMGRQPQGPTSSGDWSSSSVGFLPAGAGGLGISDDALASKPVSTVDSSSSSTTTAVAPFSPAMSPSSLLHAASAPARLPSGLRTPRKQRSVEGIRAKREILAKQRGRYEGAESGDDEDEELGHMHSRTRSPLGSGSTSSGSPSTGGGSGGSGASLGTPTGKDRARSGSKLGIEMMRTNSRGSVVSGDEIVVREEGSADRAGKQKEGDVQVALEGLERLRIAAAVATGGEEVLETLPEDKEREVSSPDSEHEGVKNIPAVSVEGEFLTSSNAPGRSESSQPTTAFSPQPSHPTSTTSTPPHTYLKSNTFSASSTTPLTTHEQQQQHQDPDTEVTPRPLVGPPGLSAPRGGSPGDGEPTPRAPQTQAQRERERERDRDRSVSRTREKMMSWIRR